ncbi:phage portal protein family protein [Flavobacterium sp.]
MAEEIKKEKKSIIIHDLTLVAADRSQKDIGKLKSAVVNSEAIYAPNRAALYDLYHDVVSLDGHLQGIIEKRIDSVLNKELKFIDKSGKENDAINEVMDSNAGRDLIKKIIESKLWGISGVEFIIGPEFKHEEIDRKHIKPEKGLITKSQYSTVEAGAYKIDELPFVWVIGGKKDLGKLLACSMYAIFKRGNFGDWAQYVEIFGQPVRVIKYDAYDTKTRLELKEILEESGTSLAMMIPKTADFEMLDGKTSNGDGQLQERFKEACNAEMSIAILGNTETTSSSKSSGYAQSKEHGEQQDEITKSDMKFVANMLNSQKFLDILKSYGFDVNGKFYYENETDVLQLKTRMEIDTIVSAKVPVSDDYWYDTYGIPKPDNYDELKAKMDEKAKEPEPEPVVKPGQKKPTKKGDLTETKEKNLIDKISNTIADFFDRAQH